jgi:hypothetical protein
MKGKGKKREKEGSGDGGGGWSYQGRVDWWAVRGGKRRAGKGGEEEERSWCARMTACCARVRIVREGTRFGFLLF